MNYLAHLYLAKPTADSHFGNLLGDFGGRKYTENLPLSVVNALNNHYLVDKFTDAHPLVKDAKVYFSPQRRRFSGVAIDVLFDHFLIKHWQTFEHQRLTDFKHTSFGFLHQRMPVMPCKMQRVITSLTEDDWFKEYETLEGVGVALDNIAKRIRFINEFTGAVEDIKRNYRELDALFLAFFPELIEHVRQQGIEEL
ncbi:ACP phosphodiesterase [Pseudoalteromonas sp. A601]|uniref:acyl carrier protein phosphodiesterase n=1 Tax=Pseudoalteromonas sp. A601 TaxID=1967839 RepID=UPI000B3CD3D4|nr:ACP phosphodiesterase [Pseudoalteromonas sp. A601]OUS72017.1 ACP phosphodiesterase [Pseudoalteromonas sp. A601]